MVRVAFGSTRPDSFVGSGGPEWRILRQRERVNSSRFLENLSFEPLFPLSCLSFLRSDPVRETKLAPECGALGPARVTHSLTPRDKRSVTGSRRLLTGTESTLGVIGV